jgi:hypothetical protein
MKRSSSSCEVGNLSIDKEHFHRAAIYIRGAKYENTTTVVYISDQALSCQP